MRIVVDTNVVMSGVFFAGPPSRIVRAWKERRADVATSLEIVEEYRRVGAELAQQFPGVDPGPVLEVLVALSPPVHAEPLGEQVCTDPDDDKFLACAVATGAGIVVSGDRALLKTSGYRGIRVMRPREFVEEYLRDG